MAEVVTIVSGFIEHRRVDEVADPYREAIKDGLPPELEETFLLKGDISRLAIVSVWRRRADLDAMLTSGEEPFARRLIRNAGGEPEVAVYEVIVRG
jgi:hypothetical protein